jgi:dihydroorotase
MLVDDPKTLEAIFAGSPVIVATHCEDTPTIVANEARFRKQYGEDVPLHCHPAIRSREACLKSSSLAIDLARRHGTRLHVLHLTTAEELDLFRAAPTREKAITAEVCAHHLFFNDADYATHGALIKCNPSIKRETDRQALLQAVRDGRIDIVATDHAPHTREEKQGTYFKAPSGLPLVQYALLSLLEHYQRGELELPLIVEKTSHAVARLFDIKDRGFIREGYWADLVLVDLDRPLLVEPEAVIGKCGWSPFEGYRFRSSIAMTLVNGRIVYRDGQVIASPPGMPLEFDRA